MTELVPDLISSGPRRSVWSVGLVGWSGVRMPVHGVGALGAIAARSGSPYRQVAALPSNVVLETVVDADRRIGIVGDLAGELIHLGQSVMHAGDTIDRFINTTLAVPTRTDVLMCKYVAYGGLQRPAGRTLE
jgi:hypothetical protein